MRLTKVASALAAALLMTISVQASAGNLKVWCWDENFNIPAVKKAIDIYRVNHPGTTFTIEYHEKGEVLDLIHEAFTTSNYSSMADIILMEDYSSRNLIVNYPGLLKDLTADIDPSKYVDYKTAVTTVQGKTYGIPFDTGVTALFVRIDLFEKAGFKLSDFEDLTWDKFILMGRKVKNMTGVPLLPYDPTDLQEIRIMMQSAGSWYTSMEDSSKITIENNEALKESLLTFKRLNNNGLLVPYKGWDNFLTTFQKGKVSAVLSSCWLTPSFEEIDAHKGKWRVVKIPKMENASATSYSNQGGSQWFVNARSRNAAEAVDFLNKTFGSDINLINQLVHEIGLISSIKDIYTLPNYQKPNPFFGNQLLGLHFTEWTAKIPAVNYGTHTIEIEDAVEEALKKVMAGEDVNAALKAAQVNATNIYKASQEKLKEQIANRPAREILAPENDQSMDVSNYPPPTTSSAMTGTGPVYIDMDVKGTAVTQTKQVTDLPASDASTDVADYPPLDTTKSTDVADYPPLTTTTSTDVADYPPVTDTKPEEDIGIDDLEDLNAMSLDDHMEPAPLDHAAQDGTHDPAVTPASVIAEQDQASRQDTDISGSGHDDLKALESMSLDDHMKDASMTSTDVAAYPPVNTMSSTDVADYPPVDSTKSTDVADYPPVDSTKSTDVADYPPVDSMKSTDVADYPPVDSMKSTDVADYPPVEPVPHGAELDDYSDIDLTVDPELEAK
ncbi:MULTISPECIES: hypothetical protein [unclassified Anaerobiospirillum]|uniref:hypothetical protein n=1 Tax=unclassified Anaerobiospirillum TaxID=2647410 RepID=UPI001FF24B25|nr:MULTISPECIES: hypothetical protein [unclassified Anaerobiospirillum]MCK0534308.1 hypothetical protein [Anaerobiospirillum sp. NML120511]MCK0539577.1 hypothetical protein [Anaerobiospirillum sp. NML02-A-032]